MKLHCFSTDNSPGRFFRLKLTRELEVGRVLTRRNTTQHHTERLGHYLRHPLSASATSVAAAERVIVAFSTSSMTGSMLVSVFVRGS